MKCTPKKFYRFQIYSKDVMSLPTPSGGTPDWRDGYWFLDIPTFLDGDRYQVAVESMNFNGTTNAGYVLNCTSIPQPNSYTTSGQCHSQALLNYNSTSFYHFIDFSSIGIPLKDMSFMRSKQIRFQLTGLDGNIISATAFNNVNTTTYWVMSLVIFPIDSDDI